MYQVIGTKVVHKRQPGTFCIKKVRVVNGELKALAYSIDNPDSSWVFDLKDCELVKKGGQNYGKEA